MTDVVIVTGEDETIAVIGEVGPKGDKGDQGIQGIKGDKGDPGDTSYAAATATALSAGADRTKLDSIATGATANSSDATLLARANHTGTQLVTTISNLGAGTVTATGGTTARSLAGRAADTLSVKDFGAVGDGTTDDTAAVQAWIDVIRAKGGGRGYLPAGSYRITGEIDMHPLVPLAISGDGRASEFLVDFSGVDKTAIKLTHPTAPTTRGKRIVLSDFTIRRKSGLLNSPNLLEARVALDLKMERVELLQYGNNTALRLSDLFNCDLTDVNVWGAGYHQPWKTISSTATFSITSGLTTLSANEAVFDAGDVGKAILVNNSIGGQVFTISAFTDSQSVTVSAPAVRTITDQRANWEGIRGSITAASSTLTLNTAALTSADVGRIVWVLDACAGTGTERYPLRARITAVTGASVTLDTAATSTVTNVYVVVSPAVEIFADTDRTNDAAFSGLHIEEHRGAGLMADMLRPAVFNDLKIHCLNGQYGTSAASLFNLGLSRSTVRINGFIAEGQPNNSLARVYVSGAFSGSSVDRWNGIALDGQVLLRAANGVTGTGLVMVGDVALGSATTQTTMDAAFSMDASTQVILTGEVSTTAAGVTLQRGQRGGLAVGAGTVTVPAYSTMADLNTGMFFPSADAIAITNGGVERARIASDGTVYLGAAVGAESLRVVPVASAVNHVRVYGSAAGAATAIGPNGTDTNCGLSLFAKGAGTVGFYTSGLFSTALQVAVTHTASANRWITLTGSNGGNPRISTSGGALDIGAIPTLPTYTVATLPTASTYTRGLIYVSDGTANQRLAISDGTNWRFPSGAIVS
jgi:hypothetical protein